MKIARLGTMLALAVGSALFAQAGSAVTLEELAAQLEALAAENQQLRRRVEQLEESLGQVAAEGSRTSESTAATQGAGNIVKLNHEYSYEILDPTTNVNRKQRLILESKQRGDLQKDSVYLSGAVTAIANYQKSNTDSKFGYLMRHPTANNQRTKEVSEAIIHSAQLALTANMGDWVTAYAEMLYDPQQSFGTGTTTDLNRNQVQVRRGYAMVGNLDESPYYVSLGKMAVPFGLTDTVNPFSASSVWHAFGGLAYGANLGYLNDGLSANLMGVQGGAQFRAANVPVNDSNVPSKLNNYALDVNYTSDVTGRLDLLLGASYLKGSAYCQDFPVQHFEPCKEENGAWDVYSQLIGGDWMLQAEFARTESVWPGTFNPTIPEFPASKVTSWNIGGKVRARVGGYDVDWSADFSRFIAGPDGAPWESQDQWVLGASSFLTPSVKGFVELVRTEGYVPLNFISGGNLGDGVTHSEAGAHSNVLLLGVNVGF